MPTIEIASFQASKMNLNPEDFIIAFEVENKLESHRSLFYDFLLPKPGVIIHLFDPFYRGRTEYASSAGALIDWSEEPGYIIIPEYDDGNPNRGANQQFKFRFRAEFRTEITRLLQIALHESPVQRACLLTDYQFGPAEAHIVKIGSIETFWKVHDEERLRFNVLYIIE